MLCRVPAIHEMAYDVAGGLLYTDEAFEAASASSNWRITGADAMRKGAWHGVVRDANGSELTSGGSSDRQRVMGVFYSGYSHRLQGRVENDKSSDQPTCRFMF